MRLSGGAYAVYQQLSEEKRADFACIKDVLYTAFALNPMMAYKQFAARHLCPGEMVDVFLAELRKLATQFGRMTEWGLVYAFIAGLPEHVEKLLQAITQVDNLLISEILFTPKQYWKTALQVQDWQPQQLNYQDVRKRRPQLQGDATYVRDPTIWHKIVLGGAKIPGPKNLSLVIGASDRVTLHKIVQETNKGTSLQLQSLP